MVDSGQQAVERLCSIDSKPIPAERLAHWDWARTCSKECSIAHGIRSRRRAQRNYQRRKAAMTRAAAGA